MKVWLDVHLPPTLAPWLETKFGVKVFALRDVGMTRATDKEIFTKLAVQGEVVMTKDSDFVALVRELGPPPQVILLTCGNTSNKSLRRILEKLLPRALMLLAEGEPIVEIQD